MTSSLTVSVLCCHDHVPMAMTCLDSMQRLCSTRLEFRIHDDGSLTQTDCERLRQSIAIHEIVHREEADDRAHSIWQGHPRALRWREGFPLALKVMDAVAFCDDDCMRYVDSDVLFLRPFHNPLALPNDAAVNALFMRDRENSYSMRSWQKLLSPSVKLPDRVNSGLMVIRKSHVDYDFVEWFLGRMRHLAIPSMAEQTMLACLGMRMGCRVFDRRQVRVMREGEDDTNLVAGHFTARTRHLLRSYEEASEALIPGAEPQTISLEAPGRCSFNDLLGYEVRRLAARVALSRGPGAWSSPDV